MLNIIKAQPKYFKNCNSDHSIVLKCNLYNGLLEIITRKVNKLLCILILASIGHFFHMAQHNKRCRFTSLFSCAYVYS